MSLSWEHRRTRAFPPTDLQHGSGRNTARLMERQAPSLFCGGAGSLHAKLLLSLGPWPALKESRVLKMVRREKDEDTAQATIKFLGAQCWLWVWLAEAILPVPILWAPWLR